MKNHTLIIFCVKGKKPENIDEVINIINLGLCGIEYFGIEIDNQADYIDENMKKEAAKKTFLEFHFDTENEINYETYSLSEVTNLILKIIKESSHIDLISDEKDATLYLHY